MRKALFIAIHLGLGDAIVCAGLVRALAVSHPWIILPAKWHNLLSVSELFGDLKNVTVLGVKDDQDVRTWMKWFGRGKSEVLGLGVFSVQPLRDDWDRQMYEQAGVWFGERWRGFKAPPLKGMEMAVSHIPFVHDDPKRGFEIKTEKLPGSWSYVEHNGKTVWEHLDWLAKAPEIHVIDSCFLCLADCVETAAKRLVWHKYARPGGKPPTLRKTWEVIT